jgi:hypothetical protein
MPTLAHGWSVRNGCADSADQASAAGPPTDGSANRGSANRVSADRVIWSRVGPPGWGRGHPFASRGSPIVTF